MPLADSIATPHGKRRYVRTLFATIADRYDFITVFLSYGQDRRWKKRLVALAAPSTDARALDLATGTGDIAFACAERGARVVGLDITERMIGLARDKERTQSSAEVAGRMNGRTNGLTHPTFLVGDMLALPFPSASFDLVTTGYGLRNVPDLTTAIDEIRRVLRPGGALLSLDFDRPSNAVVRASYLAYLTVVGGALGWILHRDPDTYRYIPASIRQYPGSERVAEMMRRGGFSSTRCHRVLGGLMAIHHAVRD
jgi:demethylmenaquinone methyltransferase/2-methoxy-6-polyprenyl-1,4-benzoquinol methylase